MAGQPAHFTRFRGDGWQMYLGFPGLALAGCLLVAARLRASGNRLATRISVGVATVERLGTADLSDAAGDAFVVSGQGLDQMNRGTRLAIGGRGFVPEWQMAVFDLIDWQTRRWSPPQAEAVALAICKETATLAELAAKLGITRQAFQARLQGAGFLALESLLNAFQSHDYKDDTP